MRSVVQILIEKKKINLNAWKISSEDQNRAGEGKRIG